MIEEVGILTTKIEHRGNLLLTVRAKVVREGLRLGDSVAVSGPCLTVVELTNEGFTVEASAHTIKNTTVGVWTTGRRLNLERALMVGDRLGGHMVQGHIDAVGKVARVSYKAGAAHIYIDVPQQVRPLIPSRGSVAVDGVSLTVAEKNARGFVIIAVPFTLEHTTLSELMPGQDVNIETDLIIRWLAERLGNLTGDDQIHTGESNRFSAFGDIYRED